MQSPLCYVAYRKYVASLQSPIGAVGVLLSEITAFVTLLILLIVRRHDVGFFSNAKIKLNSTTGSRGSIVG
jgi:hypothetical protein